MLGSAKLGSAKMRRRRLCTGPWQEGLEAAPAHGDVDFHKEISE